MKQKRLMLLGGLRYLRPVIKAAHNQGYYVITCDYLPDNYAHKYSDQYINVSITDKDAVLNAAKDLHIDGILSFAVDPGVVTAAYVQKKLSLPSSGPYESVVILQNKDLFRSFLQENGFNCPWSRGFENIEEILHAGLDYPCIIKPTDSAGSKGVSRLDGKDGLREAAELAFSFSHNHRIIIEQFLEKEGESSDSDCMSINGELVFKSYSTQLFDRNAKNPYAPASFCWPSTFTKEQEDYLSYELQRLLSLLKMGTSIYNVETRIATDGRPYIMEVSPRGGGNRLAEMSRYATGVDMITAIVRAAVGDSIPEIKQQPPNGYWSEIVLHAPTSGVFWGIEISPNFKGEIIEEDIWYKKGDKVNSFESASDSLGTLVIKFDSKKEMLFALHNQATWLKVKIK